MYKGWIHKTDMAKHTVKDYLRLFKDAFEVFKDNHPIKFASAIAYFALFALPCILLIIIVVLTQLFSRARVLNELRQELAKVVGEEGGDILVVITESFQEQATSSIWMLIFYSISVFWLSTQLFRLFQNSLNDLWRIKPDYKSFWKKMWVERGLPFILVIITGLLFFANMLIEYGLGIFMGVVGANADPESGLLATLINSATAILVFLWFALLYKILPAVKIEWQPTLVGAAVTAVLFFAGIALLWFLVVQRDLEDLYAYVAPIIQVALWIFYSSLVFLYGASFTKVYAHLQGKDIQPAPYAYKYVLHEDKAAKKNR
jgi:membrane protein